MITSKDEWLACQVESNTYMVKTVTRPGVLNVKNDVLFAESVLMSDLLRFRTKKNDDSKKIEWNDGFALFIRVIHTNFCTLETHKNSNKNLVCIFKMSAKSSKKCTLSFSCFVILWCAEEKKLIFQLICSIKMYAMSESHQ